MVESINSGSIQFPQRGEQVEDANGKQSADAIKRPDTPGKATPEATQAKSDRVDLSDAARKLADLASDINGATPESGTLPPERLAEIAQRLHDGFYESDAVREDIARRILPDLESDPTE
jgi:anti-sigma28 factor (negative regulator of flagellin synthesis)